MNNIARFKHLPVLSNGKPDRSFERAEITYLEKSLILKLIGERESVTRQVYVAGVFGDYLVFFKSLKEGFIGNERTTVDLDDVFSYSRRENRS